MASCMQKPLLVIPTASVVGLVFRFVAGTSRRIDLSGLECVPRV
jgi:hypothetical protein